ncbi:MAG: hypothetical protein MJ229_05040 [bacterium]|nr:hypothetical protein [bacterium]
MLYELRNLEKYNKDRRLPLVNFIRSIQFVLFILVISTLIYWLLTSMGLVLPEYIAQAFDSINMFGALIVTDAVVLNGAYVHFSFGVTIAIFLGIIKLLDILVEFVIYLNNQLNLSKEKIKEANEKKATQRRHEEYIKEESKNNKILLMVRFGVEYQTSSFGKNSNNKITSKTVMSDFFSMLEGNIDECSADFVDDDLLLIFNPFDNIDNFIRRLNDIFRVIEKKYLVNGVKISLYLAADTAAKSSEILAKQENLIKLLELAIKNKVVCVESFKKRYAIKKFPNWNIQSIGTYNIDGFTKQEVYVMEPTVDDDL